MKKLVLAIQVSGLLAVSSVPSGAYKREDGWYGFAGLGASFLSEGDAEVKSLGLKDTESYNAGLLATAGVGYKTGDGFRLEAEYAYRGNKRSDRPNFIATTGDGEEIYRSSSIMGNIIYEFNRKERLRPYIGAGVGYTFLKHVDDHDSGFAYQGILGGLYRFTDDIELGLAYKYFSTFKTPEMSVKATPSNVDVEYPYSAHSVELRGILNF